MIGELLRKVVALGVLFAALVWLYVTYENSRPCVRPIEYSVGMYNAAFDISREAFAADLAKAAEIWNRAAGKEILRFVAEGGVPVSLVYDERQQTAELGEAIHEAQRAYDAEKVRVDAERVAYEAAQSAYNEKVAYWNSHGGAPRNIFKELEATREALTLQQRVLNTDITALNARVRDTNATVQTYNKNIGEFEQGEYRRDRDGARIMLYEFTTETQLVRLAAHEFGHALGLDHVEGVSSIMYPENKGKSTTLSTQDVAALKTLCDI